MPLFARENCAAAARRAGAAGRARHGIQDHRQGVRRSPAPFTLFEDDGTTFDFEARGAQPRRLDLELRRQAGRPSGRGRFPGGDMRLPDGNPCVGRNEAQTSRSRGNKVSPVPPHPGPLPWGEGAPPTVAGYAWTLRFVAARPMVLPLPKGEGWGEGEATARLENRLRQVPRRSKILRRVRSSEAGWALLKQPHTA